MSSPVEMLQDFAYLTKSYVDCNFRDGGEPDDESYYRDYTHDGDTSGGIYYKTESTVGMGMWGMTGELDGFHKDSHQHGRSRTTFFLTKYSNGFFVSQNLLFGMKGSPRVREDQFKFLEDRNGQLKEGWAWLKEIVPLRFQTSARSSTADGIWPGNGSDGLPFASATHKTIRSPQSTVNNAQGLQPFTISSAIETTAMMQNMKGDDNRPGRAPKRITWQIGRYNQWKIKSPLFSQKMPGTANNDPNVLTQGGKDEYKVAYDYIVNKYLDQSDSSWIAFTDKHMMYVFEPSKGILFQTEVDIHTAALTCVGRNYLGIDFHSFRYFVQAPSS